MPVDPAEDALRHFSGLLRLVEDQWQERSTYDGFHHAEPKRPEPTDPETLGRPFREDYALQDVTPGVSYSHRWDQFRHDAPDDPFPIVASRGDVPTPALQHEPGGAPPAPGAVPAPRAVAGASEQTIEVPPPGAHVAIFSQANTLSDRDLFFDGENAPVEAFAGRIAASENGVDAMLARVEAITAALPGLAGGPGELEAAAIGERLEGWADVEAAEASDATGAVAVVRMDGPGVHVDGATTAQAPRPNTDRVEPTDDASFVQTGGNRLVNELTAVDAMHGASATVVLGDAVSLDAIVQINAWDTGFLGPDGANVADTEATNVAAFARTTNPVPLTDAAALPATWVVTHHTGDLVQVTWSEQTNLVGDEDMVVFEAGGTETLLVAGGNTAFDVATIFGLGETFDLIIVTGDYAHANFIQQTNVLVNRDAVSLEGGAGAAGGASVLGGGDVLWNVAEIRSIGEARFEGAEANIAKAARAFADEEAGAADLDALEAVVARAGEALRVLVVEGDMIDLAMVRQTNVLGDDDAVATLARDIEGETGSAGIHIDLHGGGNLLLNAATIVEAGPDAGVHVAGTSYSDAILVQAELIGPEGAAPGALAASGVLTTADPAALASEAVAFLQDAPDLSEREGEAVMTITDTSSASVDVMASMVG